MTKSGLRWLSQEEAERLIADYMAKAESYAFGVLSNGTPAFIFKRNIIEVNADLSVTWVAHEVGIGLHTFIELVTGKKTQRRIVIPLCLVNPKIRQSLKPLLASTVNPSDGRLNSKSAEFFIVSPDGVGVNVSCKLGNLAMYYVMLQLFPSNFLLRFASQHCPFCREMLKGDAP